MKQYSINHINALYNYLHDHNMEIVKTSDNVIQLRSCQAWIIPVELLDNNTGVVITGWLLQSYYTIVSIMYHDPLDNEIVSVRLGKWSSTTSKQQSWFERGYWN